MANFIDRLLNLMGAEDEGDSWDSEEYRLDESSTKIKPAPIKSSHRGGRLISFPSGKAGADDGINKVVLTEVTDFDQLPETVDHLRNAVPVVINLRRTNPQAAQRLLDLFCGVVFALDGKIAKVEEAIFLLTPKGVEISANLDLLSLDPQLDWLNR